MEFEPAEEVIGKQHQVRTVGLKQSPHLPDGDYTFVDTYCTDISCDCRRTLIQVLHNGIHVSTIGFGWESPDFYKNWLGVKSDDDYMLQLDGATIDISSPNKVSVPSILAFFKTLLDEKWICIFKSNYDAVKAQLRADTKKGRKQPNRAVQGDGKKARCP